MIMARRATYCPGMETITECQPGSRCTNPTETYMSGMCVYVEGNVPPNVCRNMCDTAYTLDSYNQPGKAAGTMETVAAVRAGNDPLGLTTCPGLTIWVWLWVPILLCCCIACCAGAYYAYTFYRQRLKRGRGWREEGEKKDVSPFLEEPYADYQQVDQDPMPVVENRELPMEEPMTEMAAAPVAQAPIAGAAPLTQLYAQPAPATQGIAPYTMPMANSMYSQPGYNSMSYPMGSHVTQMPTYGGGYGGASMRIG